MIIVAGHITVAPPHRETYLAGSVSIVERARGAAGCLDLAITADLVDPGRVILFERWESQAALDKYRRSARDKQRRPPMFSMSVAEYDIANVRPLFGKRTK